MTAPGIIDMIWDALETLAEKGRVSPCNPRPVKMKMEGTVGLPEIIVEAFDPILKKKEFWKISEKGLEKLT